MPEVPPPVRERTEAVFIGHDASRTGAPLLLLSALEWAASDPARLRDSRLVLLRGGELTDRYAALVPTVVADGPGRSGLRRVASAARSVGLPVEVPPLLGTTRRLGASSRLVVANTLAALPAAAALVGRQSGRTRRRRHGSGQRRFATTLVCHVHELDGVATRVLGGSPHSLGAADAVAAVDRFIATGPAVREMLVDRWKIPASKVVTVDAWVDDPDPALPAAPTQLHDPPVIMSVGSMIARKGPERFVDLMAELADHPSRPRGLWVGGNPGAVRSEFDASAGALAPGSVTALGNVEDPAPLIRSAAVVVSTATEDPFPLSVLEAGALGVPVAGFDSGGASAILRAAGQHDMVVAPGDLTALSTAVRGLLDDPAQRVTRGRGLAEWVRATHLRDHLAPRWWDAVTR